MPLRQGHQLGEMLVRNAWKVAGAFAIGVIAVLGGGLFLSGVHQIPQTAGSAKGSAEAKTIPSTPIQNSQGANEVSSPASEALALPTSNDPSKGSESEKRPRRKKNASRNTAATVPLEERASRIAIPPGPDIPPQLPSRDSGQLGSVLTATTPTLPANSPVSVRLTQQVSARESHKGEVFKATLAAPLIANGIVLAPVGAPVLGKVVDARSARLFRGGSNLNLELTEVQGENGNHLRLRTMQWYETGSHSKLGKAAFVSGEAAKKAVSGVVSGAKPDGDASDSSEHTVAAKAADSYERNEKSRSGTTLPPGSEIVFRLLEPVSATGNAGSR